MKANERRYCLIKHNVQRKYTLHIESSQATDVQRGQRTGLWTNWVHLQRDTGSPYCVLANLGSVQNCPSRSRATSNLASQGQHTGCWQRQATNRTLVFCMASCTLDPPTVTYTELKSSFCIIRESANEYVFIQHCSSPSMLAGKNQSTWETLFCEEACIRCSKTQLTTPPHSRAQPGSTSHALWSSRLLSFQTTRCLRMAFLELMKSTWISEKLSARKFFCLLGGVGEGAERSALTRLC